METRASGAGGADGSWWTREKAAWDGAVAVVAARGSLLASVTERPVFRGMRTAKRVFEEGRREGLRKRWKWQMGQGPALGHGCAEFKPQS